MNSAIRSKTRYAAAPAALAALLLVATPVSSQAVYHQRPKASLDLINAPAPFTAGVSPARGRMLLYAPVHFPDISDLAEPTYRIAGLRIDPANNGPHVPQRYVNWQPVNLRSGASQPVAIPGTAYAGAPAWSWRDGRGLPETQNTQRTFARHFSSELFMQECQD